MSEPQYFHFVLKPVQEFVNQARRTRDFWAGSFLLSMLSAVAMRETQAQGGTILFPKPNERFLKALEGQGNDKPQQGVVPNRFKASVGPDFEPTRVCEAVRRAWIAIAKLAWDRLPAALAKEHPKTLEIWRRQLGLHPESGELLDQDPFWQMTWAIGSSEDGEDLVDRRRAIPVDHSTDEAGAKCALMEGWQELSGADRPGEEIGEFWARLSEYVNQHNQSDLVEAEQLCAISLVKRLFPHSFQHLRCEMPGDWTIQGWKLETGVPSVAYLAAAPWLTQVIEVIDEALAERFHKAASAVGGEGEWRTRLRMVTEAAARRGGAVARLADLDGALFFESSLDGPEFAGKEPAVRKLRDELAKLKALPSPVARGKADEENKIGEPDAFYAVLAMDGDKLGENLQRVEMQAGISKALETFTSDVERIVKSHSGFLVYAGGDDVSALLPVPEAIPCARELRQRYEMSFKDIENEVPSTLSGAILFAHHKLPLTHVLRDAHKLLDDVAKDGRDRNALAVQITSRGGELVRWARKWPDALRKPDREILVLEDLARRMASSDAPFSHKFFHRIDALVRLVNPDTDRGTDPLEGQVAVDLFTAELLDSGLYRDDIENADDEPAEARQRRIASAKGYVKALLKQCEIETPYPRIEADGAFLVRFLGRRPSPTQQLQESAR